MHRPLPVELDDSDEMPQRWWGAGPSSSYRFLVVSLAIVCVGLAASTAVLAVRLLVSPSAQTALDGAATPTPLEPASTYPPGTGLELSPPAVAPAEEAAVAAEAPTDPAAIPPRAAPSEKTPALSREVPNGGAAASVTGTATSAPATTRSPSHPDRRTSVQRTAAWMVASHGRHAAAAQARAVAYFYDGDASGLAYWRAVLDEIERLPSPGS